MICSLSSQRSVAVLDPAFMPDGRNNKPTWILPIVIVGLIAGHGLLYYSLKQMPLTFAVVLSITVLVVIGHLGWLGRLFAFFRRRPRRKTR
jgi:drug/metabolite transporter (DMT)-like permease